MATQSSKGSQPAKAGRPWGQKILREKSLEIFREGKVAPSALMGNLLAASASQTLDTDILRAAPRAMSSEANRIISLALQRSRMPHADLGLIFDELIEVTWVAKSSSAQAEAQKAAQAPKRREPHRSTPKGSSKVPPATAKVAIEPIIVRKHSKHSQGD